MRELKQPQRTDGKVESAPDSIVLKRVGTAPMCSVPWLVRLHAILGLDWGYDGSEPSDLALNILLHYTDPATAERLYLAFKKDFIVDMPRSGGVIRKEEVLSWVAAREGERVR